MGYPIHEIHVPDPQRFAVDQERFRHDGALYQYGEYATFVLMWSLPDFEAGLVDRCPKCYVAVDRAAEAYGQPARRKCDSCFGTTFEGGYRAKIVRPSLWDHNERDRREHVKGEIEVSTASVQSTADFQMRTGDYIIRADNGRWQVRSKGTNHLRTGFETPTGIRTALGYNFGQVTLEDQAAVVYTIPPVSADEVALLLDQSGRRAPVDFTTFDEVRGPLVVE